MTNTEALTKVLQFRWINDGYGTFHCRSCGSKAWEEGHGDKDGLTWNEEGCSKNCPFQVCQEWLNEIKDNIKFL